MRFNSTQLQGVWRIELEPKVDDRGYFVRTYCEQEFSSHGLNTRWVQCNSTLTKRRGMLRGLHYQLEPRGETKLIRCVAGVVFDVLVDLRPQSPTYRKWQSFELRSDLHEQLYVPIGIAHGFQCLTDNVSLVYQMSDFYVPELARGIRWDDPALNIAWPLRHPELSPRDAALPTLAALESGG